METIIEDVINQMTPYLNQEQLDHLKNILYMTLHGKEIVTENTDVVPTGVDSDEVKIRMFIASKKAINRQNNTLKQYYREIHAMLNFCGKRIEDITSMDLRYYCGYLREKRHISTRTLQTRLHYLNSFWEFLVTEELVRSNPVKKIGAVKVEERIQKPFSAQDLESLRINCKNLRDRALVEFLYSTGVRVSELVALNIEDIEFNQRELIVYGKGGKERKTYLTESAKFYLERYLQTRKDAEFSSPLFATTNRPHKRLTVAGVQYMLRELGERANVKDVHPHRFRRTIATDLLNRGMPIEQVKEFLGHEKIDTTMIYCTVSEENVKASHRKYA